MIEAAGLVKEYGGRVRVRAVDDVSFRCAPGEVFGLLGCNGAGKTTTLRMLSTAIAPSAGTARIAGRDVRVESTEVRRSIGFLSGSTDLYGRLTPRETLAFFGRLHGMSRDAIGRRIGELAGAFGMAEFLDRPCDRLSTGMKQRVCIARTVVHDPPVMILDEPTSGLDVLACRAILDFVRESAAAGKTVLFSTHIMSEVDSLCTRVGVIHGGRLLHEGPIAEFRSLGGGSVEKAFLRLADGAAR